MPMQYIHQLGELFEEVQMQSILPDGKTFPDCTPKSRLEVIQKKYSQEKKQQGFNIATFVHENFEIPHEADAAYKSNPNKSVEQHIEKLWPVLARNQNGTNKQKGNSLITLPQPYIVPGGRFREIYYWDTYFTMLGLQVSNHIQLIEDMVKNFAYLIDTIGYIPNGNRTYYIGRSQPPFFSMMVELLAESKGEKILIQYLPQLEKEYKYWMKGSSELTEQNISAYHAVRMPDGFVMNRYWDENDTPRPEAYKEDVLLAGNSKNKANLYRNIRAAAESGWDFSSRWFKDEKDFSTIHTTEIIPIDLNSLMFHLEETLAKAYALNGDKQKTSAYKLLAIKRKDAISKYCWNEKENFYFDYDFIAEKQKKNFTLAAAYPLFFSISSLDRAEKVASVLHLKFLKGGGLITTTITSHQQWDAPNGWAPLQWIAIRGLENYSMFSLANEIAKRWLQLNLKFYQRLGKLMEKYNVVDTNLKAGGGEYPSQDGFGWTNGVLLKLLQQVQG